MSFATLSGVLSAAVAPSGTFTTGFPAGTRLGSFNSGKNHSLNVQGKVYNAPADFTIAFTSATVITYTWKGANTLPANAAFRVQLDIAGPVGTPVAGVNNATFSRDVRVNLGAPITTNDSSLRVSAALATTGSFALIAAGLAFDVPRNVIITSSGNDAAVVFTVLGKDEYGATMTEAITGANAGIAAGVKAFKSITSISNSAAAAANVKVGFGNVLGIPVYAPHSGVIVSEFQGLTKPTAGTFVGGLSPLTASTATTADVRGTYVPNSAPDGAKVYELELQLADPAFLGVPQFAG
jgi:hypothetical protein